MNAARSRASASSFAFVFACLVAAAAPGSARAQDAAVPDPSAPPQPSATVRDPDFGVVARHFGLEREVEMYQWRRRGDAYATAWSDTALDSSGFAPGHDNPPLPLHGRRWVASEVRVDGLPLDPAVLPALGRWVPFRPSFSALPGNLAATFQPQGDGLGTAEDPMRPQVGDLRIRWRELRLPPLRDRIVLADGRWRLKASAATTGDAAVDDGDDASSRAPPRAWTRIAFVAAFLCLFGVAFAAARWWRRRCGSRRG